MSGDRSHKLPGGPAAGWFYGRDLAYVHDAAFGYLARGGARTLLRLLGRARIRDGLVVDLGAGSGITARILTDAGYQVLGIELSPDMVELARQRAPRARFVCSSLLDAELPACVAVTAIGECLNYAADPRTGRERLGGCSPGPCSRVGCCSATSPSPAVSGAGRAAAGTRGRTGCVRGGGRGAGGAGAAPAHHGVPPGRRRLAAQ